MQLRRVKFVEHRLRINQKKKKKKGNKVYFVQVKEYTDMM
jgi:hypothetical protein